MPFQMSNLQAVARSIGRGVVFYAPKWDPTGALALTHLGDTEGDIVFTANDEIAVLTTPELSGPAPIEADYTGSAPTLEIPIYLADPALLAVVSPGGSAHAGATIRRAATEYTIVVFPEALFIGDDGTGELERKVLNFSGGAWTLDGVALTPAQEAILASALWCWRGVFSRPPRRFLGGAGDARRNIETTTLQLMLHADLPEGHKLFTIGDPADFLIDIEGQS